MPNIATYGVEVKLQSSAAAATSSTSARHNEGKQQTVKIEESATSPIWIPSVGMNHPIWVTTVQTPVKTPSEAAIPMKVAVNFGDPNELPDHMRGDMRIELMVDGVVSGLKFYREFKLRGKGFNLEFSGYRVDRTKERGFVFNALPKTFEPNGDSAKAEDLPNYGIAWIKNALKVPGPDPHQKEGEYSFGGLYPVQPLGLPPHVSCVQVLISVGKKYRTLERYFMAGATQKAAFYSPPRAPACLSLDVQKWSHLNAPKKNMHSTAVAAVGDAAGSPAQLTETPKKDRRAPSTGEQILAKSSEEGSWKPVGLARTQKVAQAKEVEFAVRIHLCRFWFFIVSESSPGTSEFSRSRVVTLKVPNLKEWAEEHAEDSIAAGGGTTMQGSGIPTPENTPGRNTVNTFMGLKALADAAAKFDGTAPALSDFPSPDLLSTSSPQATITDNSHHQVMPQHVKNETSSPWETGSRGGPAGAEEKTERGHKRKVEILRTGSSKPPKQRRTTGTGNHQ